MKAINPNEIKDNFIELIGKEWMLGTSGCRVVKVMRSRRGRFGGGGSDSSFWGCKSACAGLLPGRGN